jgi:hypothetical protein
MSEVPLKNFATSSQKRWRAPHRNRHTAKKLLDHSIQSALFSVPFWESLYRQVGNSSKAKSYQDSFMHSGSEVGSFLMLIDSCITQFKAQGSCRTCDESRRRREE